MNLPLFFSARFWGTLADQFLLFVVPLVVYQVTQSVAWSSLAFAIETIPRVAYTPFSGIVADFYSPLKTVRAMMLTRMLLCFSAIGLNFVFVDEATLTILIILASLTGLAAAQSFISYEVLLPLVFKNIAFAKIQSWNQSVDKAAIILGPLLAALLVEYSHWQYAIIAAGVIYFIGQVCFSMAVRRYQCEYNNDPANNRSNKLPSFKQDLSRATKIVVSNKSLWRVIAQTALVNLIFGSAIATVAALVTGKFQLSAQSLGIIQMLGAVTSIVVLAGTAFMVKRMSLSTMGKVSFFSLCFGGFLYAVSGSICAFILGYVMVVGFDSMFNVYIRTVRRQIIPSADYGKATGVIVFLNNLTKPLSGILIAAGSVVTSTENILLCITIVVTLLGAAIFTYQTNEFSSENTVTVK